MTVCHNRLVASAVATRLCEFLVTDLEWGGSPDDLFGPSPVTLPEVLDSEELLEMVVFLEEEYGVDIDDEELVADNFRTVSDLARLVETKLVASGPGEQSTPAG